MGNVQHRGKPDRLSKFQREKLKHEFFTFFGKLNEKSPTLFSQVLNSFAPLLYIYLKKEFLYWILLNGNYKSLQGGCLSNTLFSLPFPLFSCSIQLFRSAQLRQNIIKCWKYWCLQANLKIEMKDRLPLFSSFSIQLSTSRHSSYIPKRIRIHFDTQDICFCFLIGVYWIFG